MEDIEKMKDFGCGPRISSFSEELDAEDEVGNIDIFEEMLISPLK